jgi:hypothetical protein
MVKAVVLTVIIAVIGVVVIWRTKLHGLLIAGTSGEVPGCLCARLHSERHSRCVGPQLIQPVKQDASTGGTDESWVNRIGLVLVLIITCNMVLVLLLLMLLLLLVLALVMVMAKPRVKVKVRVGVD